MTPIIHSKASSTRGRGFSSWPLLAAGGVVVALVATGIVVVQPQSPGGAATAEAISIRTQPVTRGTLDVVIRASGELQAVNNIELASRVEGRTTVTMIVPEGSSVTSGQVVVELDSSGIRQQLDDARLEQQRAESAVINARSALEIQKSNNEAELEGATVGLMLAELDLKRFEEGEYPQQLASARAKVESARTSLANAEDDLSQSRSLFQRGFVTAAEVRRQEVTVGNARTTLMEAETALRVLTDYAYQAELATKRNAVVQARNRLERVKAQSQSMVVQREADLIAAELSLGTRTDRVKLLESQLEACVIRAPADGLVVYVQPRDGNTGPLQLGAEVRERQVLIRLPDTRQMKAVLRVNEAQVTPIREGLSAMLRVTGAAGELPGTVTHVSLMADSGSGNWWSQNAPREYPVDIRLDPTSARLKPGMTVRGEITVERLTDALSVPVTSLFSVGRQAFVFVVEAGEVVKPRQVRIGAITNDRVQIIDGLSENHRVLELKAGEGRRLLEQSGIKADPATQPGGGGPATNPAGRQAVARPDRPGVS